MYNRIIFSSTLIIYRLLLNESPSISFRLVGLIFSSAVMLSMKIFPTTVFVAHSLAIRHRLGVSVFIHHLGSPQSISLHCYQHYTVGLCLYPVLVSSSGHLVGLLTSEVIERAHLLVGEPDLGELGQRLDGCFLRRLPEERFALAASANLDEYLHLLSVAVGEEGFSISDCYGVLDSSAGSLVPGAADDRGVFAILIEDSDLVPWSQQSGPVEGVELSLQLIAPFTSWAQ